MGLIQEFQQADAERRSEVATIAQEATAIVEAADTFVKDLIKGSIQRRSDMASMVRDFAAQDQRRQVEVAAIAQETTAIIEAADSFVKDLAKGSVQRRSEVATMLRDFGKKFADDCAKVNVQRRSEVAAIHEMVWGKAPTRKKAAPLVKELPREAAIKTAPDGELGDKVFAYLTNHPDGTRLTELEEKFGIARIQTARVIRELMDSNKVEKRDLLYFII